MENASSATPVDFVVMLFEYVLYQELLTPSGRRTFFKTFQSMVPPAIGWSIQQFDWNEEGHTVEAIFINPRGVCFVGLETLDGAQEETLWQDYLTDFVSWIELTAGVDLWRMPIEAFRSA
jgi:hypothetical protein